MKTWIPPFVFVLVSIVISLICQRYIRSFKLACLTAGLFASAVFQIIGYFAIGYLDPFFIVAFVVGFGIGTIIAVLVGLTRKYINL